MLGLAVNAAYIAQAVVMARAVTLVFNGSGPGGIVPYIITAFACALVRGFFSRVIEVYSKVMAASVKTKIRLLVFDKILRLGPAYINTKRSGQVQSLVLDGIESLEPFLVNYVPHIITISISGLSIAFYLFNLDALPALS
jgi:ABC-type transport system involved in cytochrome bd biosynthesis fused ATPase/permease subunit